MGRLFWKILFFTLFAQALATAGIGGALWLKHRSEESVASEVDTSRMAAFFIEAASATLTHGGPDALRTTLTQGETPRPLYALDEEGRDLLGRSVNPAMAAQARSLVAEQGQRGVVREVKAADGHAYLLFLQSFGRHERRRHEGDRDDRGEREFRPPPADAGGPNREGGLPPRDGLRPPHGGPERAFLLGPLLNIITAVVGSLIFATLVAWYFSRPIRQLRSAFDAAAAGDLDTRLADGMGARHDELADLGRDFDRMTGRLRELVDGQRRLLHDVSHELRSPLARLQAAIGLARQRPQDSEAAMDRIERECVRMDKLVGELLTLSRLEAGVNGAAEEDVDMAELLHGLVDDAGYEAQAHGKAVALEGDPARTVRGQPDMLRRAIENVLRNAVRHTAPGTTVVLRCEDFGSPASLRLLVEDSGSGVPEAELGAIFEPFVRGSSADSSGSGGHGLGLAIARRVVLAHGGYIRAFNRTDGEGGLAVEIILPQRGAAAA